MQKHSLVEWQLFLILGVILLVSGASNDTGELGVLAIYFGIFLKLWDTFGDRIKNILMRIFRK